MKPHLLIASSLAGTLMLAPAHAETLNAAVGLPDGGTIDAVVDDFAKNLSASSELDVKVFSLSLLSLNEIPSGLRDGIVDIGVVVPAYFPAEYSEMNFAADLSMLATSGRQIENPGAAMGAAVTEYVMLHCPECLEQFKSQSQVYLGTGSSSTYVLNCTKPIRTPEDLQGTKVRALGSFGRWVEHFGGTAVVMSGNEIYDALSQGVVDCAAVSTTELNNLSLFDHVEAVTLKLPGGTFAGSASQNFNRDVWQSLPEADRASALQAAAKASADLTWRFYTDAVQALEDAPGKDVEVITPDADFLSASDAFVTADISGIGADYAERFGLEGADEKTALIASLIDKYKDLTADIALDREALQALYWDEIFSKLDAATYGMD